MKLLLDANLSWRLIRPLQVHFTEIIHVKDTQLNYPSSDISIWNYAYENGYCIVTNDEDFLQLLLQKGFPPKIILLRTGNQSNKYIQEILIKHEADIISLLASNEYGLLEIYD